MVWYHQPFRSTEVVKVGSGNCGLQVRYRLTSLPYQGAQTLWIYCKTRKRYRAWEWCYWCPVRDHAAKLFKKVCGKLDQSHSSSREDAENQVSAKMFEGRLSAVMHIDLNNLATRRNNILVGVSSQSVCTKLFQGDTDIVAPHSI